MLEHAKEYLARGLAPIPNRPRDKKPLIDGWQRFSDGLPTEAEVCEWWSRWSSANIGLVCGPASRLLVLDIDPVKGGRDSIAGREIPSTPSVTTGSGGWHIYFRYPTDGARIGNRTGLLPGVDIRGHGGQVCAPPSLHPCGGVYRWRRNLDTPFADPPAWLLDALLSTPTPAAIPIPPSGGNSPNGLSRTTLNFLAFGALEGERNDRLFKAACDMAGNGCGQGEAEAKLLPVALSSGLTEREVRETISSAFEKPRQAARVLAGGTLHGQPGCGIDQVDGDRVVPKGTTTPSTRSFCRATARRLRENYTPTRWKVENLSPGGGIGLLAGIPGIGKTFLVLAAALSSATGGKWLGRFACEKGRVLLILGEEDENAVLERLDLLYAGLGLSRETGDALPVEFLIQQGIQVVDAEGNLDAAFEGQVREFQPDLLIIDPLRRVHGLDENDSLAMSRLFNAFRQVTTIPANTCSILLTHHLRKRNEFDGDLDRLRGSSDIPASCDSVLEVGGEFGMLRVKHSKSKRGPTQKPFMVRCDVSDKSIRLAYFDQEEATENKRAEVREFVIGQLQKGDVSQSELWGEGRKHSFGRDRIKAVCEKLQAEGRLVTKPGPRGSKILHVVDAPAPPPTTRSKEDESPVLVGPWREGEV